MKSDGTVVGWGYNDDGETNVPAGLNNVTAVAAGGYHSLALRGDGTVVAWGNNFFGQANVPAGLNNVIAVTAGLSHSLALKSDGTVVAWGDNSYGQTNVSTGLNNVLAIAPGSDANHVLALQRQVISPATFVNGTLADTSLSLNVALLNANQTFIGQNTFNNATVSGSFTGNGSGLFSLNANNISSGSLADGRLSTNVALLNANQVFTGSNEFRTNVGFGTPTPAGLLEIQGGADWNGSADPHAIALSYRTGGYRHWIRSRHNVGATSGNAIDFFVNTHINSGGSTAPGIGNVLNLTLDNGNVGIGNATPTNRLHVTGGATFQGPAGPGSQFVCPAPGSGSWSFTSDRNTKDRVQAVNTRAVLEKVAEIPINEWSYIGYQQRHIGPMAQDFHEQFPLSSDDKSLNEADLHGVALAAIQGLNHKLADELQQKETEIRELKEQNGSLEKRLEALEQSSQHAERRGGMRTIATLPAFRRRFLAIALTIAALHLWLRQNPRPRRLRWPCTVSAKLSGQAQPMKTERLPPEDPC